MPASYVIRRLLSGIAVLFAAFTVTFILLAALPGDAVAARFEDPQLGLTPEQIAEIRNAYGLDKPLLAQYFIVLSGFLTGNFGYSAASGASVTTLIGQALPGTLVLAAAALTVALIVSVAIAYLSYRVQAGWLRKLVTALPATFVSLPVFLVGIVLIQVVSFRLGLVPVIGASPLQALILPTVTLAVPIIAPVAQVLVRSVADVANQPYVTVARAKGASRSWLFFHTIVRNALLPAVTMIGLIFGELIGGAVVTEAVFSRPGIGSLTVLSVANRDTPVLLAIVVLAVAAYVVVNIVVDLLYPLLDPRLQRRAPNTAAQSAAQSAAAQP
ncbi:ABC transporter permease [Corynebacterium choanae]|uniref:ABC transporter permease n=1 Tax=Corynebacterium choanae TaxID=1862358 RepID=UPI000F4FC176|nr:ABC transporter permease [Corynebacterium choanae]